MARAFTAYRPTYVRTLSAAATAVAPVYDFDESVAISRLQSGRYQLRMDFILPVIKEDVTTPLWTIFKDASDFLTLQLSESSGHTLQIVTASGTTSIGSVGSISRNDRCGVSVLLASDGAYRTELLNRTTGTRYTYSGTLSGWAPFVATKVRLGCEQDGSGQNWLLISRFGVLP